MTRPRWPRAHKHHGFPTPLLICCISLPISLSGAWAMFYKNGFTGDAFLQAALLVALAVVLPIAGTEIFHYLEGDYKKIPKRPGPDTQARSEQQGGRCPTVATPAATEHGTLKPDQQGDKQPMPMLTYPVTDLLEWTYKGILRDNPARKDTFDSPTNQARSSAVIQNIIDDLPVPTVYFTTNTQDKTLIRTIEQGAWIIQAISRFTDNLFPLVPGARYSTFEHLTPAQKQRVLTYPVACYEIPSDGPECIDYSLHRINDLFHDPRRP